MPDTTTNTANDAPEKKKIDSATAQKWFTGMIIAISVLIAAIILVYALAGYFNQLDAAADKKGNWCILLLAALCGCLGAMVHMLRSFTAFRGADELYERWLGFYITQPFIGASLAMVYYFIIGAGLLKGTNGTTNTVEFSLAMAFLSGLFTDLSLQKLKDIFKAIIAPSEERTDKLPPAAKNNNSATQTQTPAPTVSSITPQTTVVGVATPYKITGTGFTSGLIVKCNANAVDAQVIAADGTGITFNYTAVAADGATIKVVITDPDKKVSDIDAGSIAVTASVAP